MSSCLVLGLMVLIPVCGEVFTPERSLLVADDQYIHQLSTGDLINKVRILHRFDNHTINFLTAKSFGTNFEAVYGNTSKVHLVTNNNSSVTNLQLLTQGAMKIYHVVPGSEVNIFYVLWSDGKISRFNWSDDSLQTLVPQPDETACPPGSNIQVDYSTRILYYLECFESQVYVLKQLNLPDNSVTGKPLAKTIKKFDIDFNSREIFAISDTSLLRGNLDGSQQISFTVQQTFQRGIADLAVTPSAVYVIVQADNTVRVSMRRDSSATNTNLTFNRPQAIAYLSYGVANTPHILVITTTTLTVLFLFLDSQK